MPWVFQGFFWLLLARIGWLVLMILTLALFVGSLPVSYALLQRPITTLHVYPPLHPPLLFSPHHLTMHKCGRNVSALRGTMGSRQREISDCTTFNAGRNRWLTPFG